MKRVKHLKESSIYRIHVVTGPLNVIIRILNLYLDVLYDSWGIVRSQRMWFQVPRRDNEENNTS